MSISLSAHSLVIRRERIEAVYPGGWWQFVAENGQPGEGQWDDDLVLFAAQDPFYLNVHVADARDVGLRPTEKSNGREVSRDMCRLSSPDFRPEHPCDWLEVDEDGTALFIGRRRKSRRPRITIEDRKEDAERTREAILGLLALPPAERAPMQLHRIDGETGKLRTEPGTRRSLVVESDTGREAYRWIEDVVNAGWEV